MLERLLERLRGVRMGVDAGGFGGEAAQVLDGLGRFVIGFRDLIELRFVHELSQSEIGRHLGVSQMQVSRLLRAVCERLRTELVES